MRPIDERTLRASFLNASRKEVSDLTLPPGFADLDVEKLDYLGWVDPKLPRRSYVVAWVDDVVTGVMLQRAEQRVLARAQCSWCEDVTLRNDVQLYVARKAGPAGRKGDSIGTLLCAEFGCSRNVRMLPPLAYEGYDRELAREMRILRLQEHVGAFIAAVRG
ncbi:FBP domain-containing protein [Microbacterium sp. ANT_H45B]|uniref:FBP domain-containing protein n=1 Tax=unclassified Microbacterium TaxID=2609290 RepID=UPI0011EE9922|nr:FBP domain-containing protein [Microbacterium sp. ANT_H45B]KAA0962595.1 FBP domain-containing protein [Microbacterium sp. ANT_H45B]